MGSKRPKIGLQLRKIYFGLPERHNLNMSIFSPGNPFVENNSLLGHVIGEDVEYILNHLPVTLPKSEMGLVFWVLLLEIV
jgi:hypothetical protein